VRRIAIEATELTRWERRDESGRRRGARALGIVMAARWILAAIGLGALALPAVAGPAPHLTPGTRLRWTTQAGPASRATGTAISIASDTLMVRLDRDSSTRVLPLASLASLEVSEGPAKQTLKYAVEGGVVGGLMGLGVGWIVAANHQRNGTSDSNTNYYVSGAAIGAGLGAIVGALVGGKRPRPERWEKVNPAGLQMGLRLEAAPRYALALAARF
jgi:hypothetical protein